MAYNANHFFYDTFGEDVEILRAPDRDAYDIRIYSEARLLMPYTPQYNYVITDIGDGSRIIEYRNDKPAYIPEPYVWVGNFTTDGPYCYKDIEDLEDVESGLP